MKKYNLRSGMILETRKGRKLFILPFSGTSESLYAFDTENSSQVNLNIWDDNLLHKFNDPGMDVIKVYALDSFRDILIDEPYEAKLIWERPSEAELKSYLEELLIKVQGVLELL